MMQEIRLLVGEIPIVESEQRKEADGEEESLTIESSAPSGAHTYVTADGTYATQSALSSVPRQVPQPFYNTGLYSQCPPPPPSIVLKRSQ